MKVKKNHTYQVWGDLSSEKSGENYPTLVLCDTCAAEYEIVVKGGETSASCEGENHDDSE